MASTTSSQSENGDSVSELIRAARDGSQQALGKLLENYRDYLLLIAQSDLDADLRPKGGASDLVQETFLEAQRDFANFRGQDREAIRRWLSDLLRHNVIDFVRRHRLAERRCVGREQSLDVGNRNNWQWLIPADSDSPSGKVAAREEEERLIAAIDQLPEDYREVIRHRHMLQRPWAEVAEYMGRTEDAVQKLWVRALARLRRTLSDK